MTDRERVREMLSRWSLLIGFVAATFFFSVSGGLFGDGVLDIGLRVVVAALIIGVIEGLGMLARRNRR